MTLSIASISYFIFFSCFAIQSGFWLFRISAFLFKKKRNILHGKELIPPFSIIVAAKNEYKNLQTLIPHLLQQNGGDFEIIIANDCSTDQSHELLDSYTQQQDHFHHIAITEIPEGINSKKHALALAIEKASYEKLVFTDADCIPSSNQWASIMASSLDSTKDLVLGLSPYQKKKGLLNLLIRLETVLTALNYISFALWQIPYMGVGRNMAYTKSAFIKNKGFKSIAHITGGDDDLLVQQLASKNNSCICLNKKAYCISSSKETFSEWIKQKRRHYGVGKYYSNKFKFILGLDHSSQLFLIFSFLIHVIFSNIKIEMVALFLLGLLLAPTIIYVMSNKSGFKASFLELFFLFPFMNILLTGIGCYSFFSKHSNRWN